jgi:hypothetical protein
MSAVFAILGSPALNLATELGLTKEAMGFAAGRVKGTLLLLGAFHEVTGGLVTRSGAQIHPSRVP